MGPANNGLASQDSVPAVIAHEERVLGCILVARKMPTVGVTADDFSEENAKIWTALFGLHAVSRPITVAELWRRNRHLDPANLARLVATFVCDPASHSRWLDAYAIDLQKVARRQPRQEPAA